MVRVNYIIPVTMDFRVILYFVLVFEFLVVLRCEPNPNQGQLFACTELRIRHFCNDQMLKWGAFSRWSFRPHSARGSIETTTIEKTRPTNDISN